MDAILNSTFFNIATVAVGLGFVIFIHELGHFLVAKWCKVKVEAFALGFGPSLISYRKGIGVRIGSTMRAYEQWLAERGEAAETTPVGETEYSIRAVPLGGFVKMLGEGEEADTENVRAADPRAYPNKPVSQRMAIISAGVIMNVISGLIFFAIAYGRGGLPQVPARISAVVAGEPAYNAGMRAGDEILAVDGQGDVDFFTLRRVTAMSGVDQVLNLTVRRPEVAEPLTLPVQPERRENADMKQMGIAPTEDLVLAEPPFLAPAGFADPGTIADQLRVDDRIVAAGPEGAEPIAVADIFELRNLMAKHRDTPVTVVVERGSNPKSGTIENSNGTPELAPRTTVTLPVVPFVDLGIVLDLGPVAAIRPGSPAVQAGFRVGDKIVGVEGMEVLDPLRLPDYLYERAGREIAFQVARSEGGKPEEVVTLTATPAEISTWVEPHVSDEPMDVAELGLAYSVGRIIQSVRPGSPAEKVGLEAGRTIDAVILTPPAAPGGKAAQPVTQSLDPEAKSPIFAWPAIFEAIQRLPRHAVGVRVAGVDKAYTFVPDPDPNWNNPNRGLRFQYQRQPMPPLGLAAALSRGLQETRQTIVDVYGMFRSLILQQISPKALGGPIMIADVASQTARAGLGAFLQFLGLLSLNLAVINFLPIPPLDGGQMTFLIAEMLRGRPLPEKALSAGTIFGLVLVLTLMVFVIWQDIMRYVVG